MPELLEIKCKKQTRVVLFLVILFVMERPRFITYITSGTQWRTVFFVMEILVYVYILLVWINNRRVSGIFIMALLLYGTIIISTLYNGGSVGTAIQNHIGYIFMVMLIDNEIDDIDSLWQACILYLMLMTIIDSVVAVSFPGGLYPNNFTYNGQQYSNQRTLFFSAQNGFGIYLIYFLFFKGEYDLRKRSRVGLTFYILFIVGFVIMAVNLRSLTTMVGSLAMFIIIVLSEVINKMQPRLFSIYSFMGIVLVMFISFVVLSIIGNLSGLFITDVLGGSLTFSGRKIIWEHAIDKIALRPILGYGYMSTTGVRNLLELSSAPHAHDYFLQLGLIGGCLAIVLYLITLVKVADSIKKKQYDYTEIVITAFMFAFLILSVFEYSTSKLYWAVFAYAFYRGKKQATVKEKPSMTNELLGWSFII